MKINRPTVTRFSQRDSRYEKALKTFRAAYTYNRLLTRFRLELISSDNPEEFINKIVELLLVANELGRVDDAIKFIADLVTTSNNRRVEDSVARAVGIAVSSGKRGEEAVQSLIEAVSEAQAVATIKGTTEE